MNDNASALAAAPAAAAPISCLVITKEGTLQPYTMKQWNVAQLYKRCGFKQPADFVVRHVWRQLTFPSSAMLMDVELFGKVDGRPGSENQFAFPPPANNILFFGQCALVASVAGSAPHHLYQSLTVDDWTAAIQVLLDTTGDKMENDEDDEDDDDEDDDGELFGEDAAEQDNTRDDHVNDHVNDSDSDSDSDSDETVVAPDRLFLDTLLAMTNARSGGAHTLLSSSSLIPLVDNACSSSSNTTQQTLEMSTADSTPSPEEGAELTEGRYDYSDRVLEGWMDVSQS